MPRGNPVINVSLASDVGEFIKDIKSQLGTLGKAGVNLGLADSVKAEIDAIEKLLDGLQKTMNAISGKKLNSSTFSSFQKQIGEQIEALDQRTTALESNMEGLMKTMSKSDGGQMASNLQNVRQNMDALCESTQKTVEAIGEVQSVARNNSNIQIIDATKSIGDLKALKSLAEGITKQFDKETKFTKPKNAEEAIQLINKLTDEYGELDDKISELDEKEERTFNESKKLLDYKNRLVEVGKELERIYDYGYEEGWGGKLSQFDYLTQQLDKELSQIEEDTRAYVDNINKELSRIGQNANVTLPSSDSIDRGNKGLTVPIGLRTTSKGLLTDCMKILNSVQSKLSDSPLEVDLALTTKWGTKRNKELLKSFQEQINGLTDQSNIDEFQSLYDKVAKSFGDEIGLKIGSNIDVVEKQIIKTISKLRKEIKDNPLNIDLEFDVSAENKAALQAALTDITSDIVVTIKKVKFAKELNVKNTLQQDFDQLSTDQLDKLLAKIDELKNSTAPMVQTIAEIKEVFNSFSTDKLVSELKEVIRLLQVGFDALSINELDNIFSSLQQRISNISGSLRGANLTEIRSILADFKEYQSLGGQNSLADLGGSKNIQNWLNKHINDQDKLQAELNETANEVKEVNTAIESENITQLIQPLTQVIALIDKTTQAYREGSVVASQSIDSEISDLNRLSTQLEEVARQIQVVGSNNTVFDAKWLKDLKKIKAEDLSRVSDALSSMFKSLQKLDLSDNNFVFQIQQILDKGKELSDLAKVLSESSKKLDDISERVNTPFTQDDLDLQQAYKDAEAYQAREKAYQEQRNAFISEGVRQQKEYVETLKQAEIENEKRVNIQQKLATTVESNLSKAYKYFDDSKYTEEFTNNINESIVKLNALRNELDKPLDATGLKEAIEKAKALSRELNENIAQKALPAMKKASEQTINKAILKIDQFVDANSKMGRKWRQEFENLRIKVQASDSIEDVQRLTAQVIALESSVIRAGKAGASSFDTLAKRIKQMSTNFIAMHLSLYDIIRYARSAVGTIRDLDDALIDLRKTTTMTNDELNAFYYDANDVAKQMGTSTKEIISQAAAWSRLGYQSKEAATEMAALSSQFAAISPGMSLDKATDGLVSTMKAFNIDVADVERQVMDNVNRIGNTMATSNEEIVEMLTRSSAAMNAANNSIEETIALESAAVQITRNAETTGTAFRTISMRIRGYDEETEEFIGNVEQLSGDIADLTKTAEKPGGISLFTDETKTEYKSTYELLKEIAGIYHDLTDKQQAGLLEKLAGKRGGQVLAGILEDFSEVEKAMTEMGQAAGSADDEMKIIEESISYKLNALKETWVGLLQDMMDRGTIDEIIDMLIKLSEAIVKVVEANPKLAFSGLIALLGAGKLGGLKTISDTISGLGDLAKGIKNLGNLAKTSTETAKAVSTIGEAAEESFWFIDELADGSTAISTLGSAAEEVSGEVAALEGGVSGLAGALGVSASALVAFAAAAALIAGAAIAWDAFTVTVKEAGEAIQDAESKVLELQSEINELNAIESRTDGQQQRLKYLESALDLQNQILESARETYLLEKYGSKFSDQFDSDNAYTQYHNDMAGRALEFNGEEYVDVNKESIAGSIALLDEYRERVINATEADKDFEKAKEGVTQIESALRDEEKKYSDEILDYNQKILEAKEAIASGVFSPDSSQYANAAEMIQSYSRWVQEDLAVIRDVQKALGTYDDFTEEKLRGIASNISYGGSTESTYRNLIDLTKEFSNEEKSVWFEAVKDANSYSEAIRLGEAALNRLNNTQSSVADGAQEIAEVWNLSSALSRFNINEDDFSKYLETFKELNDEIDASEEAVERAAVAHYAFDTAVEDLRSHLNDYEESITTLDKGCIEFGESVKALADDLTALTGVDFSLDDAESFLQDAENLELLRQALDGDNEALTRLRANAALGVYIHADADLNTEAFNSQYNELVNFIAENPDIGTIEAQSYLDTSPFVQNCIELVKQGKMTSDQLRSIFSALGWNIDFKERTEYIKLPKVTNMSGISAYEAAKSGKRFQGYNITYEKYPATIIDDIKFVDKRTATRPTSSSGSNYKPSQKSGGGGGGKGGGGGSSKDPTEEAKKDEEELEDTYDEFFDYFERRVKVVTDAISLLDAHLENVVGSKAKNKLLDAQERLYRMQQQEYADAKDMYQEMADNALAEIPDDLKDDVLNGAVAIDEFIGKGNEEVVNAINDYTKWADKVSECKQKLAELKEELRQLELKRFQNIAQDWQDLFDLRQNNAIDLISKQIDLFEEAGELIGKNFYEEQRNQASKQYDLLKKEREALIAELNRGLSNGTIEKGTDEWLEMVNTLSDLEGSILDCAKAIEEFDNAILQLHVDVFERIQNQFDDFDDQLSDMADFLDDEKVSDKYGEWSKEGLARAGLLTQQYELAQKQVHDYGEEIKWLNKQYEAGKYSTTEYMDRLADLNSKQRDYAQQAEDAKDAIIDLNKARVDIIIDGIEEEIDAYSKLIQKEKDALSAEKDLHEWRKQLADSTKAITDIEKQLAAMENDNSAAAIAKKKQLQQQLKEAQDNLAEQEYDHSITAQQDALDQQLEQYKEARQVEIDEWNAYLENISLVMSDTFTTVQENAIAIGETITQTAQEHGFKISEALTSAWQAGEGAIASYGEILSASTSVFIENLDGVEQKTLALQAQADATSQGLAQMFANRADNLVSELQRSWDSEANLENMTHALSDAFVEALDSGYRIGEVVAPMEAAKEATDAVASAADGAASAFDNMAGSARSAAAAAQEAYEWESKLKTTGGDWNQMDRVAAYNAYKSYQSTGVYDYKHIKGYARGLTKAQQDELAWTQELGDEIIISPTRNSILTPIKSGDQILDAQATKNLWELAKIDPKDLVKGVGNVPSVQQTKAISVNFGSAIEIQGNVNDSLKMAQIASQEAQNKIAKTLKDLNDEMKY